ncbi:BRO-N domain-containing protein [Shewanella xiamenensis]|uniref:BRO-N domain-containing protein n=1 Tax=Shewanella xiamenensis TaxID=332186 RepID=UPI00313DACD6
MNSLAKACADYTIFKFDDKDVRVVIKNGEPWFVAVDLCDALNLTNSRASLMALDDDEKDVSLTYTLGGKQMMAVVSESGMFTLILRCRDAVKQGTVPYRVRKWVTAEVLPSIRKTGSYEKTPKAKKSLPGKITLDQQTAIKQLVMYRGKSLPKDKQAKAIITMWSALKSHFGTTYKQIAEDQFTEALSLAARVPLDGEFIPAAPAIAPQPLLNEYDIHNIKGLCTHMDYLKKYFDEYKLYEVFTMLGSRAGTQMIDHMRDGVCFAATVRNKINELDCKGLSSTIA